MSLDTVAETPLSDRDLVLRFESLGGNCEFGLVQRRIGVEPLGLFRFSSVPLPKLIRALNARFEGMADPDNIVVKVQNNEYMIRLTKYGFLYHADMKVGEGDPDALVRQQSRTVGFLIDKLIADLEKPEKIMVFRQNEELSANHLLDFRAALAAYGPVPLLWVQEARPDRPAGSVSVIDATLMVGYVTRLAKRDNAPDFDLRSWMTMLRDAHQVWLSRATPCFPAGARPIRRPVRVDIVFGREGNAAACTGEGWSNPEDGFTWSLNDRSVLVIDRPEAADRYRLEMHVRPFVAPAAVADQTMGVLVNGVLVHTFDPLPRGAIACSIPGHLVSDHDTIEVLLDHPRAISPKEALGQRDDRRLAVSFHRMSLICD